MSVRLFFLMAILISLGFTVGAWQQNEIPIYQDSQNFTSSGMMVTAGNISTAVTSNSGSFTRAANATGTQTINIGFIPAVVYFSTIDDGVASVYSDGWDNGTIAVSSSSNSLTLLSTLIAGPGSKSHIESIYLSTLGVDGWSGHITTKASDTVITFSKLGSGRAMTVKWLAIK